MPDERTLTLRRAEGRARAVAAGVLNLRVADLTDDTPLGSGDLALIDVQLSLAGFEIDRCGIETVGQLIKGLRRRIC